MNTQATPEHARHDQLLIAAYAAGDASPADAAKVETLVATCVECGSLARDLAAIRSASRLVPAPRLNRDFRLTPQMAAELRGRSPWRRLVDGLTGPRGFGRPLSAALVTMGLAGLMVSFAPGFPGGAATAMRESDERSVQAPPSNVGFGAAPEAASGSSPSPAAGTSDLSKSPAETAGAVSLQPAPAAAAASPRDGSAPSAAPADRAPTQDSTTAGGAAGPGADAGSPSDRVAGSGAQVLAVISALLLVAGIGLLLLRRALGGRGARSPA